MITLTLKGKLPKVMGRGKLKSGIEDITLPIMGGNEIFVGTEGE